MKSPIFVAEFTTNHMGNFNLLMRMVEAAVWAGADYIKMQKKDVWSYYTEEKLSKPYDSPYGKTYADYRNLFEFDIEDFAKFDRKCKSYGIKWYATVQDMPSLYFLLAFDLPMYKVASSHCRNLEFLKILHNTIPDDRAVVMSVAGSTVAEVVAAADVFEDRQLIVQHCVAEYPCRTDRLRLGNISTLCHIFKNRPNVLVGYSGHEEGIIPSIHALRLGAVVIERHFCISRHSFVHHIECSLEPDEFRDLVYNYDQPRNDFLPPEALDTNFGMSEIETEFLVRQTYGNTFIKERSEWTK